MTDLGVVAAYHGHGAPQNAGLQTLHQRLVGAGHIHVGVGHRIQRLDDGLAGVTHGALLLHLGDVHQILVPVLEVLHRHGDNLAGVFTGILGGEVDKLGIGHPGNVGGGDKLGMEALAQGAQGGEDALHIHHNRLHSAGEDRVLLLEEVAGHPDAVAHGHLVGGAAHAGHVDPLGAHLLGHGDHLGLLGPLHDHLGEGRIMAMDDDVDHVLLQDAQVGLGIDGLGGTKQNIGEVGTGHGAAPAVAQAAAQGLADQGLRLGGAAHVGHVQGLGDLPVDGPGLDALPGPDRLALLVGSLQEPLGAEGLAVLQQRGLGHLVGNVVDVPALGGDIPLAGDPQQLLRILHLVVAVGSGAVQGVADLAAVVGVGGGAAGGEPQEVPAGNAVGVAAADAPGRLGSDAAGTHGADPAADALFTELAVRGLLLHTGLPGAGSHLIGGFKQLCYFVFHLFEGS